MTKAALRWGDFTLRSPVNRDNRYQAVLRVTEIGYRPDPESAFLIGL